MPTWNVLAGTVNQAQHRTVLSAPWVVTSAAYVDHLHHLLHVIDHGGTSLDTALHVPTCRSLVAGFLHRLDTKVLLWAVSGPDRSRLYTHLKFLLLERAGSSSWQTGTHTSAHRGVRFGCGGSAATHAQLAECTK
jgi:hypothetical protein